MRQPGREVSQAWWSEGRCISHGGGERCGEPGCDKAAGLVDAHLYGSEAYRDHGTRDYVDPADGTCCVVMREFWPELRAFATPTEKGGKTVECFCVVTGSDGGSHVCGSLLKFTSRNRHHLKGHLKTVHPEVFAARFAST